MSARRRSPNSVNGDKQQKILLENKNCNQYPIIGIDLGISYWSAALVQNGKVLVIPFFGKNNIPAFVARLNNEYKFGNDAKQKFFDNREVTIFDIIYVLGLRFNAGGQLEEHMNDYSYTISNFGDKPKLSFTNKKSDITLEELFDIIINNLIYTSEVFLNKTVHNIVVPIPVYFKESQKSALLKATTHVGIIELIFEPIAAAYAYRIHEKYEDDTKSRNFLIYNLQEDNLDVSVVQYENNKFNIKSNRYERHLKRNYTFRLLDELCTQTYETYFISNPRFHPLNSGTLRYYCKTIFEDILYADCFEIEMDTVRDEKIVRTISRTELDELLRVLVQESLISVENVLREAKLETRDIDEVLLVGQVTRHTIVRQQLKYLFGRHSLNCTLNPEDVLVIGAALRADILQREIWDNNILNLNPIPIPISEPILYCKPSDDSIFRSEVSLKQPFISYPETGQQNTSEEINTKTKYKNTRTESNITRRESNICPKAEADRKFLQKQKTKQKIFKNDPIKKGKIKLSLRDKMLSMCSLFSDVVNGSNLKITVKEKLLLVPSYLRNKLISRPKSIKKSCEENQHLRLVHKNPSENIPSNHGESCTKEVKDDPRESTIKQSNEEISSIQNPDSEIGIARALIFPENSSIFEDQSKSKLQTKHFEKCDVFEKQEDVFKYNNEDFYSSLNLENVPEEVGKRCQEKPKWSLKDKVNCIKEHLDMFYVTVFIVVFVLHWASENICINVAIALISIAITLILNNRATIQRMANN